MARPSAQAESWARNTAADPQDWPLRSHLELAALPTAVSCARLHIRNVLHEWRMGELADTAELLASEIMTNAVRSSAAWDSRSGVSGQVAGVPVVRLWLSSDRELVLIEVWDSDPRGPVPQAAGPDAESGRGLLLVEALSARWGWRDPDSGEGKVVWAVAGAIARRSS